MEFNLQTFEAVEKAIWAEEIRLQDEASDAEWLEEILCHNTALYKLC